MEVPRDPVAIVGERKVPFSFSEFQFGDDTSCDVPDSRREPPVGLVLTHHARDDYLDGNVWSRCDTQASCELVRWKAGGEVSKHRPHVRQGEVRHEFRQRHRQQSVTGMSRLNDSSLAYVEDPECLLLEQVDTVMRGIQAC